MSCKKKKERRGNKKAQVTLFVIIALVIIFSVFIVLIFRPEIKPIITKPSTPQAYIEKCVKDETLKIVDKLSMQGGDVEVKEDEGYVLYGGNKVRYLCYTNKYYRACINQQPLLKQHVESEISKYLKPRIEKCFENFASEFREQGYEVQTSSPRTSISIEPKKIIINIDSAITMKKGEDVRRFEKFRVVLSSPLYDLVMLANKAVNAEARYGDFNLLGYMLWNPVISIDKTNFGESTIYTLRDRNTNKVFIFAVRSYVMPPGPF